MIDIMKRVKGIIFDFDNTLVDTKGADAYALEEVIIDDGSRFNIGTSFATSMDVYRFVLSDVWRKTVTFS